MQELKKNSVIVIDQQLVKSKVWLSLGAKSKDVLLILRCKCKMCCQRTKDGKKPIIANNGEIEFTYIEAEKKYNISNGQFRRAIDELLEKGFIDISYSGAGLYKSKNNYAVSYRWKLYGKPEYQEPKPRPMPACNRGFKKGNQLGKNCEKK